MRTALFVGWLLTSPAIAQEVIPPPREVQVDPLPPWLVALRPGAAEQLPRDAMIPNGAPGPFWLAWSPDGRFLASSNAAHEKGLTIWDIANKKPVRRLSTDSSWIVEPQFTRDGKFLIAAVGRAVVAWDAATGEKVYELVFRPSRDDGGHAIEREQIRALRLVPGTTKAKLLIAAECHLLKRVVVTIDWREQKELSRQAVETDFHAFLGVHHFSSGSYVDSLRDSNASIKLDVETDRVRLSRDASVIAAFSPPLRANDGARSQREHSYLERSTGRALDEIDFRDGEEAFDLSGDGRWIVYVGAAGLEVYDQATDRLAYRRTAPPAARTDVGSVALSPDRRWAAAGHRDGALFLWDVSSAIPGKAAVLEKGELAEAWEHLISPTAPVGMKAVWRLRDRPEQALVLIQERLIDAKQPSLAEIQSWIGELDHDAFRRREAAERKLRELGDGARVELERKLTRDASEEQKVRVSRLLEALSLDKPPAGDDLRTIRCVQILEAIASERSRAMLKHLASRPESLRSTIRPRDVPAPRRKPAVGQT
jgi:hypothetical protein